MREDLGTWCDDEGLHYESSVEVDASVDSVDSPELNTLNINKQFLSIDT